LTEAQRDLDRKQSLVEKQFIAQSEADRARALVNTSQEALKAVQAQVGVAQAGVKSAQANVAQREAALAQARIDLARTRITSPVSGIVIKRAIERGQTVAASLQAPELFIIAQNLQDMQVDAAIDESDVGRMHTGQKASFTVDAFPGQTFEGQIKQVRKAATNVANVVTYVAVVAFSNPDGKLLPGMTANVRVVTDQRQDVLKVPNGALRMRIAGVESAEAAKPPAGDASAAKPEKKEGAPASGGEGKGGGPMAEFRNKLLSELQLKPDVVEKVDAIYADARPKFMQTRDLLADQKPRAREKILGEVRSQIEALLTPEQKTKYAALLAEAASRTATRGRIYVLDAQGKPKALNVRLGVSDGSMTELLPARGEAGELPEGAEVIVGTKSGTTNAAPPKANGPRPPF
jgi:HlyD family secretion protein